MKNSEVETKMFWRDVDPKKHLKIVNPRDFTKPNYHKANIAYLIGPAISDPNELIERNQLIHQLFHNPVLRKNIEDIAVNHGHISQLPEDGNDFLAYYSKENEFWKIADAFVDRNKNSYCKRLASFCQKMQDYREKLYSEEIKFGESVSAELSKVTTMTGYITMTMDYRDGAQRNFDDDAINIIIGKKEYSNAWGLGYTATIPRWTKNRFFRFIGITALIQSSANKAANIRARKSALIENMPESLSHDLRSYLSTLNHEACKQADKLAGSRKKADLEKYAHIKDLLTPGVKMTFKFEYDQNGLSIVIVDFRSNKYYYSTNDSIIEKHDLVSYYNNEIKKKISKTVKTIVRRVEELMAVNDGHKHLKTLKDFYGIEFRAVTTIPSKSTDYEFQWSYINNIYSDKKYQSMYLQLMELRRFFWNGISDLWSLTQTINSLKEIAKEHKLPLCVAKINQDQIGVRFKNLCPLKIMDKVEKQKLISFTFPELNGKLICLTGRHGGGKSVAGESVLQAIYMAQSLTMVFADYFEFDIKDMIAAITNEVGEGSKTNIFLDKTKELLIGISKAEIGKSVIFVDEVGENTQESSGTQLAKQIATKLAKEGHSAIVNTQILSVAQYVEKDLGGLCLMVNKNHQFQKGIGGGELEKLIHEKGLDKYLN